MITFLCPHGHETQALVEDYVARIECSCCGLQATTQKPLSINFDGDDSTLNAASTSGTIAIPSWITQ